MVTRSLVVFLLGAACLPAASQELAVIHHLYEPNDTRSHTGMLQGLSNSELNDSKLLLSAGNTRHLSFSTDGSKLLVVSRHGFSVHPIDGSPPFYYEGKAVYQAKFLPDNPGSLVLNTGDIAVYSANGNQLRRWSAPKNILERLVGLTDTGEFRDFSLTPDGKLMAATTGSGLVIVCDLSGGQCRTIYKAKFKTWGAPFFASISPGGSKVAILSINTVEIVDSRDGKLLQLWLDQFFGVKSIAFSPDGRGLLIGTHAGCGLWDLGTTQPIWKLNGQVSPVFSRDGSKVATGAISDGKATIWDAVTGQKITSLIGHRQPVGALAFGADGRTLATASEHEVRIWNLYRSPDEIAELTQRLSQELTQKAAPKASFDGEKGESAEERFKLH